MKNFWRAVRDSFNHWPVLVLATLCSMGVAALWSANIGAMYPVIKMTLEDKSIQSRLSETVEASEVVVAQQQTALDSLKISLQSATDGATRANSQQQIADLTKQLAESRNNLAWQTWQYDLASKYLPADAFKTICVIMLVVVASTMVKHLMMLANELMIGKVSTTIVRRMRTRIFDQALSYDRKTYQTYGTSGLLASITQTSEMLSNGLINFFGTAIREPLRVIACLIGAAIICWRLLLLSIFLAPLLILVGYWFNRRVKSTARSMLGRNSGFHEVILEALGNIFTVQAYTMEAEERRRFADCSKDMQKCSMKMIFYTGMSKPFTELIGVGMISVTICAGAYLIVNKATHIGFLRICDEPMTASRLMIFFAMLIGASDPLRKMSGVFAAIYSGSMAADSLYGMLDQPRVLSEPKQPAVVAHPYSNLQINDVSFGYAPDNPVLKNVSLSVPYGKTVAILGANGSGKSTLIQILCRFYDPDVGGISIDGIDYRQMSVESIRKRIALVSQQTELFNRSVMENIRYGSPDSTPEQAIEAAKFAHAHEFITKSLPNGYETIVGQAGQRLSGGQRQRIALARAILRKPEILILDESTSQIDMVSELQIRQSLAELKGTCTIIIITHREALIALADAVYEVRDGHLYPSDHGLKASA